MRKLYLTFLPQIISSVLIAQVICPDVCSDLTNAKYGNVQTAPPISYAKTTSTPTFKDVQYDDDVDIINPGPIPDCINDGDICTDDKSSLFYKVFYPADYENYAECPLPCIIVAHGGFFYECSEYTNITGFCRKLASRGFVVFAVEYRRGRKGDDITPASQKFTSVQQMLAIYKACQDIRGAIRSIIKRGNSGSNPWKIDVNNIFLAGESAGAVMVLTAAYYTQAMMNQLLPATNGGVSIVAALGPIDADFYYGETDIDYISHIKGVYGQSSGIFIPNSYASNPASFFPANTPKIPAILFHGVLDDVFALISAKVYLSPVADLGKSHAAFNSESLCLNASPFKVNQSTSSPDLIVAGAMGIRNYLLQPLGIKSEIYLDCQMYHTLDGNGAGFRSDFGTGLTTNDAVTEYEAARAATFSRPYWEILLIV